MNLEQSLSRRTMISAAGAGMIVSMGLPVAASAASGPSGSGAVAGVDWTVRYTSESSGSSTGFIWNDVAYGSGTFVAVNGTGYAMTSSDGVTWTTPSLTPAVSSQVLDFRCVAYGEPGGSGLFVASGLGGGDKTKRMATSPDGVTWTRRTTPDYFTNYYGAAWGNGTFVVVGQQFSAAAACLTSTDGITWSPQSGLNTSYSYNAVTYGNSKFVAVGPSSIIMTSTDAVTWTQATAPASGKTLHSVTWSGDKFVAVGAGGTVWTSSDGTTWAAQSLSSPMSGQDWNAVTFGSGVYVAVSTNGTTQQAMSSIDGISWAPGTTNATSTWYGLAHGGSRFVAVGGSYSGTPRYQVMTSP
jgi:hypothetical protein